MSLSAMLPVAVPVPLMGSAVLAPPRSKVALSSLTVNASGFSKIAVVEALGTVTVAVV